MPRDCNRKIGLELVLEKEILNIVSAHASQEGLEEHIKKEFLER